WQLALWCEEQGLRAEATAHLTAVTRLDPGRDAAWKRLGCRKYNGRWMTPEQISALKSEEERPRQGHHPRKPPLARGRDRRGGRAGEEAGGGARPRGGPVGPGHPRHGRREPAARRRPRARPDRRRDLLARPGRAGGLRQDRRGPADRHRDPQAPRPARLREPP